MPDSEGPAPQTPLLLAAIANDDMRIQVLDGLPCFGWRVLTASAANEISGLINQHEPDALVVDVAMADRGAGVLRSLPLLRVALVPEGDIETKLTLLRALKINACLDLPLNLELVAASLDGLLRLSKPDAADENSLVKSRAGEDMPPWSLSRTTWTLTPPGLASMHLTQSETTFISTLAESPGNPVSRPQMIAALGHNVEYYDSRRLDTLVSRLRIKINRGGSNLPVRCIHSVGYAFVAPIVLED
jgi:DNA-binding response OmpR family regulator